MSELPMIQTSAQDPDTQGENYEGKETYKHYKVSFFKSYLNTLYHV